MPLIKGFSRISWKISDKSVAFWFVIELTISTRFSSLIFNPVILFIIKRRLSIFRFAKKFSSFVLNISFRLVCIRSFKLSWLMFKPKLFTSFITSFTFTLFKIFCKIFYRIILKIFVNQYQNGIRY